MAISNVLQQAFKRKLKDLNNSTHTSLLSLCQAKKLTALASIEDLDLQVQLAGFTDPAQLQKELLTSNILNLETKLTRHQEHDFNPPIISHTQGPLTIRQDMHLVSKDTPSMMMVPSEDHPHPQPMVATKDNFIAFAKQHTGKVEDAYLKALSFTKDTPLKASQQGEDQGLLAPQLPQITANETFDNHCATLLTLSVIFNTLQHKKLANRFDIRAHAVEQCEQIIGQTKDKSDLDQLKPWVQALPLFKEHQSFFGSIFRAIGKATTSQQTLLEKIDDKIEKLAPGKSVEMTRF